MNIPSGADVDDATRETLASLAVGDPDLLAEGLEVRAEWCAKSGLDERSYALVKLAALTALDAPGLISLAGRPRAGCRGYARGSCRSTDRDRAAGRRPEASRCRA